MSYKTGFALLLLAHLGSSKKAIAVKLYGLEIKCPIAMPELAAVDELSEPGPEE